MNHTHGLGWGCSVQLRTPFPVAWVSGWGGGICCFWSGVHFWIPCFILSILNADNSGSPLSPCATNGGKLERGESGGNGGKCGGKSCAPVTEAPKKGPADGARVGCSIVYRRSGWGGGS